MVHEARGSVDHFFGKSGAPPPSDSLGLTALRYVDPIHEARPCFIAHAASEDVGRFIDIEEFRDERLDTGRSFGLRRPGELAEGFVERLGHERSRKRKTPAKKAGVSASRRTRLQWAGIRGAALAAPPGDSTHDTLPAPP